MSPFKENVVLTLNKLQSWHITNKHLPFVMPDESLRLAEQLAAAAAAAAAVPGAPLLS